MANHSSDKLDHSRYGLGMVRRLWICSMIVLYLRIGKGETEIESQDLCRDRLCLKERLVIKEQTSNAIWDKMMYTTKD